MAMRSCLAIAISAVILIAATGCSSLGINKLTKGNANQVMASGIKSYEDGDYKAATKSLKRALDMGLTSDRDIVQAHKYLAFIYCLSGNENKCHDEFRKALDKDRQFDLKPEEAGHPIWGPVFRDVKAKLKK